MMLELKERTFALLNALGVDEVRARLKEEFDLLIERSKRD